MSQSPQASDHLRPPQQERSRQTLSRIVQAAGELLAEKGVEGTTVAEIVERAGSSVGSFYARFDGKEDLVRYVHERVWSRARARWDEAVASGAWEDLDLEDLVRAAVRLLVRLHREDGGLRQRLGSATRSDEGPGVDFRAHVEHDVHRHLLRHRSEIGHPRPGEAAALACPWAIAGIREILFRRSGSEPPGDEELAEEVSRAVLCYLGAGPSSPQGGRDVEFFDVWE